MYLHSLGMYPEEVLAFFNKVNFQAERMRECYNSSPEKDRLIHRIPRVIVCYHIIYIIVICL